MRGTLKFGEEFQRRILLVRVLTRGAAPAHLQPPQAQQMEADECARARGSGIY